MQNLFWKNNGKMISVEEVPFRTEEQLEKYVIGEGAKLLGDIFVFKRQVRAGGDIPDLLGVDRDNNLVIIENKNVEVTEDILPQILRYAIWAESNPDSIKALWFETEEKPEDIEPDFDDLKIRIVILAPRIHLSVARFVKKLDYAVELIEVKRFAKKQEEFVLLNKLEDESRAVSRRTTKALEEYDRGFYEKWHNKNSVKRFYLLTGELEKIVKEHKWKLEKKFNQNYVGFKHGFPNAFGIHWAGTRSIGVFFKLDKSQFGRMKKCISYECEYDDRWKQVWVGIDDEFQMKKVIPALRMSYEYILGK